jgi:SAM-dependent methyltransferase
MSSVFLDYSNYYDLLYRDKDYAGESRFIIDLIRSHVPSAKTLLNIGCGTGKHDRFFADAGFTITGIDFSKEMLAIAESANTGSSFKYHQADARNFRSEHGFDAVVSLFHVFSYQNSNEDAAAFLKTIRTALKPNGVGVFDYWYGPAVIHQKPGNREKRAESQALQMIRKTRSTIDYTKSVVRVEFDIDIFKKPTMERQSLNEVHSMRYFTCTEVDLLAQAAGLRASHSAWMTNGRQPGIDDWNAYSVVTLP